MFKLRSKPLDLLLVCALILWSRANSRTLGEYELRHGALGFNATLLIPNIKEKPAERWVLF